MSPVEIWLVGGQQKQIKKKGTGDWLGFSLKKLSGSYLKLVSGSLFKNGVWCLAEKMMLGWKMSLEGSVKKIKRKKCAWSLAEGFGSLLQLASTGLSQMVFGA